MREHGERAPACDVSAAADWARSLAFGAGVGGLHAASTHAATLGIVAVYLPGLSEKEKAPGSGDRGPWSREWRRRENKKRDSEAPQSSSRPPLLHFLPLHFHPSILSSENPFYNTKSTHTPHKHKNHSDSHSSHSTFACDEKERAKELAKTPHPSIHLHFPCSFNHFGEHSTGTASTRAARPTSASVIPPAACVVRLTVTSRKFSRWRSGWWPALFATGASALKKASAASKLRATRKRVSAVPSGLTVQAGRAGR